MNNSLAHIVINVSDVAFYRRLIDFLGFKTIAQYSNGFGATDGSVSFWAFKVSVKFKDRVFHRKAIGLNHVAFRVASKEAVDAFYNDYLLMHKIPVLYGGPALHPEYVPGYYAVYFEDPDRIKIEIAYIPNHDS